MEEIMMRQVPSLFPLPLSEEIVGMQSANIGKRNSKRDRGLF